MEARERRMSLLLGEVADVVFTAAVVVSGAAEAEAEAEAEGVAFVGEFAAAEQVTVICMGEVGGAGIRPGKRL